MQRYPYNIWKCFSSTDWATNLDLKNVSGAPPLYPDQVDILNEEVTSQICVISLPPRPDGVAQPNQPVVVLPGSPRIIYNGQCAGIINAGTGTIVQVTAYWRADKQTPFVP